jgi:hypothetical protein
MGGSKLITFVLLGSGACVLQNIHERKRRSCI